MEALEGAGRALDAEVGELTEELASRGEQLAATQQRLLMAEREWDQRFTSIQKENEERILVMLAEVTDSMEAASAATPSTLPCRQARSHLLKERRDTTGQDL